MASRRRFVINAMNVKAKVVWLFKGLAKFLRLVSLQPRQRANPFDIRIRNFGRMNERFYRGAKPRKKEYEALAALGINTVIDLRERPDDRERVEVEAIGIRYVNIPMTDTEYPCLEKIDAFLKLANEPTTGKFFVHCAGGRHRTGVIGAVYRLSVDCWNYDQVYSEMRSYDFYTRWGHSPLKKFVQDYSRRLQEKQSDSASGISL